MKHRKPRQPRCPIRPASCWSHWKKNRMMRHGSACQDLRSIPTICRQGVSATPRLWPTEDRTWKRKPVYPETFKARSETKHGKVCQRPFLDGKIRHSWCLTVSSFSRGCILVCAADGLCCQTDQPRRKGMNDQANDVGANGIFLIKTPRSPFRLKILSSFFRVR